MTDPELAAAILELVPADDESLSVSQRLVASRSAHTAYQAAKPRMTPQGPTTGDAIAARANLEIAARQRAQAELADPDHTEGGWSLERHENAHSELLAFYLAQLQK